MIEYIIAVALDVTDKRGRSCVLAKLISLQRTVLFVEQTKRYHRHWTGKVGKVGKVEDDVVPIPLNNILNKIEY